MPPDCCIGAVLLDLDGTLIDTAPELADAVNRLREERGLNPLPFQAIRPHVSHGASALVRVGLSLDPNDATFPACREHLLEIYDSILATQARLFPGMEGVLSQLDQQAIPWGVVTNKPGWLTQPLLERLGILSRARCVVAGDTLVRRKPDPDPLLLGAELLARTPRQCLYVGDAERDVIAAKRAGMRVLIALFGYLGPDDRPESWGADALIACPGAILEWLNHST
ncbi:MAG: HAD family hydrolase [Gammaproteobacteria bacterium]